MAQLISGMAAEKFAGRNTHNRKEEKIEHLIFKDIIDFYDDGDVIVLNNTKVFPARLFGNKEKTGARIEVFLLRELNKKNRLWDVLVDPARKIRIGNKLFFGERPIPEELEAEGRLGVGGLGGRSPPNGRQFKQK